jgi:hypothetical protein
MTVYSRIMSGQLSDDFYYWNYWWLVFCLGWVFVTAALSYRLRNIDKVCSRLCDNAQRLADETVEELTKGFPGGGPLGAGGA